jgi:hypothetical protein
MLSVLSQSAPLADKLSAQHPVTLLHKRTNRAVALGHDVMRRIKRTTTANANLAAFHQSFRVFGLYRGHEF